MGLRRSWLLGHVVAFNNVADPKEDIPSPDFLQPHEQLGSMHHPDQESSDLRRVRRNTEKKPDFVTAVILARYKLL